jgi:hypothetical protein
MNHTRIRSAFIFLTMAASAFAQADMRGHWTGNLNTPNGAVGFEFDLDKTSDGWIGSVSVPAQGANGMPLENISFAEGKGTFHLKGGAGDPNFTGTLAEDGKTLDGTFSQGPMSLPLKLTRAGDAKVVVPKPSAPVPAQFVGSWEGAIDFGQQLRLVLTISNGKTGAEAVMESLDQGNAKIPVGSITTAGTKLLLLVPTVSGSYQGDINADGTEITGTWTQLGMSTPLNLKKSAAAPKP